MENAIVIVIVVTENKIAIQASFSK